MFRHTRVGEETRPGRCEMRNMSLLDGDMVTTAARGREFWRGVLLAGGFTAAPRWTLVPVPGVGKHEVRIPDELMAALRRLADELAVPLSSVLLAAHAKVLGALSGEREVCTGYAVTGGSPLPCRVLIKPDSWRALVLESHRAERELGSTAAPFETVFDSTGKADGEFHGDTVLWVGIQNMTGLLCGR